MARFTEENFLYAVSNVEKLNKEFVEDPREGDPDIWLPPDGKIRLWSIPRQSAEVLKMYALARRPRTILELGTSAGYSTMWLASAARYYDGTVYTVEVSQRKSIMAQDFIKEARLSEYVTQIDGWAEDALKRWHKLRKIGFVFLDADKPNYRLYLDLLEPHLSCGALIIADNATDYKEHMRDYLDYVSNDPKYYSYLLDIDNGLMITSKIK